MVKYMITGHGGGGTTWMARVMQRYGLDVRWEQLGADGICSWMWAPRVAKVPYGDGYVEDDYYVIHLTRDPFDAISTIALSENQIPPSLEFRSRWIRYGDEFNEVEAAALSYIDWHKLIMSQHVDERVQVESAMDWARAKFGAENERIDTEMATNTRVPKDRHWSREHILSKLRPDIKTELLDLRSEFGYV